GPVRSAQVMTPASDLKESPISADPIPAVPPVVTETFSEPEPVPSSSNPDLAVVWTNVVEAVGRASPFVRTYLLEAHPVSLAKNVFTIGFDPEFADHLGLVDNSKNRTLIQTKLRELGYGELQVKFIQAEAPVRTVALAETAPGREPYPPAASSTSTPAAPSAAPVQAVRKEKEKASSTSVSKDDFKNDPLIKQALEIFKGQIVEVRA
ncbi:MAG: DNA polymerase III subunit gamma/tau, partial [Verrucomicrobiota bacterium]